MIVNGFSAQPELVGDGWVTDCQPWWDGTQQAWMGMPIVNSIVERLHGLDPVLRGRGTDCSTWRIFGSLPATGSVVA